MSIEVKYPDNISKDILLKADQDPEISGFVYPNDSSRERAGIYYNNSLVGFFTPRQESNGWRIGAIFILPNYRTLGKGLGSTAISKFFTGRKAAPVPISITNTASQKAFAKAGFVNSGEEIIDDDGWVGNWWIKKESRNLFEVYKELFEAYKEGESSTFIHNKKEYYVDDLITLSRKYKSKPFKIKELEWVLKGAHINAGRVSDSNLRFPIIITNYKNKLVVVDGIHRLKKAKNEEHKTIKAIFIPNIDKKLEPI